MGKDGEERAALEAAIRLWRHVKNQCGFYSMIEARRLLKEAKRELMAQPGNPDWGLLNGISEQEKRNMP